MRVDSVAHSACLWPPRHLLRSYIRYASVAYFLEYDEMPVSFRRLLGAALPPCPLDRTFS